MLFLRRDYKIYLNYLIHNGIFILDQKYSIKSKTSNVYKYTREYELIGIKPYQITDKKLIKRINKSYEKFAKQKSDKGLLHKIKSNQKVSLNGLRKGGISKAKNNIYAPSYVEVDDNSLFIEVDNSISDSQNNWLKKLRLLSLAEEVNLKETDIVKQNINKIGIKRIEGVIKDFEARRDSTSNRLHSPLTVLKKDFRKFLRLSDNLLGQIDIKNSQPFFSLQLCQEKFWTDYRFLIEQYFSTQKEIEIIGKNETKIKKENKSRQILEKHGFHEQRKRNLTIKLINIEDILRNLKTINQNELKRYEKLVLEGKFYDHLIDICNNEANSEFFSRPLIRDDVKELMFYIFFSSNYYNLETEILKIDGKEKEFVWKIPKHIFGNEFPSIYKLFKLIKRHNKSRLPLILQRIESYAVLDKIYARIKNEYPTIPLLTIHDSMVSTVENLDLIKKIMEEEIFKFTGYTPNLKKEIWQ